VFKCIHFLPKALLFLALTYWKRHKYHKEEEHNICIIQW